MESIYFEKQEGSLCAKHCLNALLQGPYFTAVDLAKHAQNLDDEERIRMAESGVDSVEYRNFLQQPSVNMDDSGYFSVQVISSCLSVWGLELVRYGSTDSIAVEAKKYPEKMKAYICNYKDHWFTVRKLAHQWFNLNSLSSGPKLISDTYLGLFLAQLEQEGYSIFVVLGIFPECEADVVLERNPVKQSSDGSSATSSKAQVSHVMPFAGIGYRLGRDEPYDPNEELQRALQLSLTAEDNQRDEALEDSELKRAIELSLRGTSNHSLASSCRTSSLSKEAGDPDLQRALNMSLGCIDSEEADDPDLKRALNMSLGCADSEEADDPELQRALNMSLECIDSEEMKRKLVAYFEKLNNASAST